MNLCIIGAGYVGLTTGACLAEIGHSVTVTDCDEAKIAGLRRGQLPIYEEFLDQVVTRNHTANRLRFTADIPAAIQAAEAVFVCVGTPPDRDGRANMAAVESVTRQIADCATGHKLIIGKSTVPVHTAERIERTLATFARGRFSFDVIANPEFLREGTGVYDFFHPDRIVVGCDSAPAAAVAGFDSAMPVAAGVASGLPAVAGASLSALERMRELYRPVLEGTFHCPCHNRPARECGWKAPAWLAASSTSAELIKHAANSFLSLKISYANAIADICELAGADSGAVLRGIGLDSRIGEQFLRPGLGFGGFCFPKDLSAFLEISAELGYDFRLLREVQAINAERVQIFLRKLKAALWVLDGKTLGVLGLAFKPGTDDTRLSPAMAVVRELLSAGVRLRVHDPRAMDRARQELPPEVTFCPAAAEVAEQAEALLILTEWPQFRQLDWQQLGRRMLRRLVVDGRNLFRAEELESVGFEYIGMGQGQGLALAQPALAGFKSANGYPRSAKK